MVAVAVGSCYISQAPSSWAVIDSGLLNSGLWRLLGGKSLQLLLGSSVTARSWKGHFSLQTQLGPFSAPFQSQGKIPLSRVAPRPGFCTQPPQWDGQQMCSFLSLGPSGIPFAVMKQLSSLCRKVKSPVRAYKLTIVEFGPVPCTCMSVSLPLLISRAVSFLRSNHLTLKNSCNLRVEWSPTAQNINEKHKTLFYQVSTVFL